MKVVVITGSTTGIGLGLARSFLDLGCAVVVGSRNESRTRSVAQQLSAAYGADRVLGFPSDVTSFDQTQNLWTAAFEQFGRIDIWINNAGTIHAQTPFLEQTPDDIRAIVDTNLLGTMNGCKAAIAGMLKQGFGQVYNMEGYGHDGSKRSGMTLYGSTKYAIRYFTESLVNELKQQPVQVCTLGPGIVITDLLVDAYRRGLPENRKWARVVFSVMADRPETVCPWLARRVLANTKSGRRIAWLTLPRMIHHIVNWPFREQIWPLQ